MCCAPSFTMLFIIYSFCVEKVLLSTHSLTQFTNTDVETFLRRTPHWDIGTRGNEIFILRCSFQKRRKRLLKNHNKY